MGGPRKCEGEKRSVVGMVSSGVLAEEIRGTGHPGCRHLGSLMVGSKMCKAQYRSGEERSVQPEGAYRSWHWEVVQFPLSRGGRWMFSGVVPAVTGGQQVRENTSEPGSCVCYRLSRYNQKGGKATLFLSLQVYIHHPACI